ncbi:hypothetical protein VaNZ11_012073, partial [Volvox africanus]
RIETGKTLYEIESRWLHVYVDTFATTITTAAIATTITTTIATTIATAGHYRRQPATNAVTAITATIAITATKPPSTPPNETDSKIADTASIDAESPCPPPQPSSPPPLRK